MFFISFHQNDLEILKNILIWSKEKNKKFQIFLKIFLKYNKKHDYNIHWF